MNVKNSLLRILIIPSATAALFSTKVLFADTGFTGPYAPSNFTLINSSPSGSNNGSVNTSGAPSSVSITGPNTGGGANTTNYTAIAAATGTYSFNWAYSTPDGALYDYPQFINGSSITLFSGFDNGFSGSSTQSGTGSYTITSGSLFGFQMYSVDSCCGAASMVISNFSWPSASTNITVAGSPYLASNLSTTVNPVFQGGTLAMNEAVGSYAENFTLSNSATNTIDQFGNTSTFSGVFSDAATLGKISIENTGTANQGSVTFSGINTYTGGTQVNAGANLIINSGAALGSGTLALVGSATVPATLSTTATTTINNSITVAGDPIFNVASGTTTTITSPITDGSTAGDLVLTGGGKLLLDATNTYTGPTNVKEGNLEIGDSSHTSASITSPVTVEARSTLSGFGTITGAVTNKGNVNPGESGQVGTLAVAGNYTQTGTSTLSVDVAATTTSKLNITGVASLAGTVDATLASGIPVNGSTRWTILSASNGVIGTYSNLTTNLPNLALVNFALSYDANDVYLGYKANYTSAATNQNQQAVATGLQKAFYSSPSTAGQSVLDRINTMSVSQAQAAFNSLSGEGVSAQQTANFSATNLVVDASRRQANYWLMDECQTGASSKKNKAASQNALPTTCASSDNRQFRSWMTGVGGSNSLDGSSSMGSASVSTRTGGGIVGFDYEVSSHLLVGGMTGGTSSNYNVSARSSTGTDSSGQVGLYSVAKWEKFYVNSIFNYGYFSGDSTRYVSGVGAMAEQTGKTSSNAFTGRMEVGYRMDHPLVNMMPFVAMQATSLQMNGFKESNTNNYGLAVTGNTTMSELGSLGIQLDRSFDISDKWSMYPLLRMAWVHEFQTNRSVNASLQALPTGNWTTYGASAASNAANIGISLQAISKQGFAIFASGNAEASSTTQSYMGELGIKWLF